MTVRLDYWWYTCTTVVYCTYDARDLQRQWQCSQSSKLLYYVKLTHLKISGNVGALTLSHRQKTPMLSTALRTWFAQNTHTKWGHGSCLRQGCWRGLYQAETEARPRHQDPRPRRGADRASEARRDQGVCVRDDSPIIQVKSEKQTLKWNNTVICNNPVMFSSFIDTSHRPTVYFRECTDSTLMTTTTITGACQYCSSEKLVLPNFPSTTYTAIWAHDQTRSTKEPLAINRMMQYFITHKQIGS